ncbi:DNA mismatch repair protein MutH [Bacillus thuringiensis]|uniref:DNA mismatch repair protein MutH n=1 Tax=Bacillus thuringiensis TaxID=1428 RepID=UPI0011AA4A9D|nr:DNA mismatch repair protein MutH [Bacillus thuringiensis]
MFIPSRNLKKLSRLLGVKEEEMDFKENLNILEITNDNGDTVEYYVGDFCENSKHNIEFNEFRDNYERYKVTNIEMQSLMVFESWEAAQDYREGIEANLGLSRQKREVKDFFKNSKLCYWSQDDEIEMTLEEEGLNYLEYKISNKNFNEDKGLVYNMSLKELYSLYNRTGVELFKDNVRVKIVNAQSERLRNNFKTSFLLGLYNLNTSYNTTQEFKDLLNNYIKESTGSEDFEGHEVALEGFWFHHNGITIYSSRKFQIKEDKVIFDPLNVSVINGAQTLTHCADIIREIRKNLKKLVGHDREEMNTCIDELLDKLMCKIRIKTIFISVDSQLKRSITLGLNSQIPVNIEDIETNTKQVERINEALGEKNKRICRKGEEGLYGGFYLLDFIKSYLMFQDKPGTARNLNKKDLEKYLNQIEIFLASKSDEVDEFLKSIEVFEHIDKWWRKRQKPEDVSENSYKGLASNGKFYFKSYSKDIYNDAEDENDKDEYLQEIYDQFVKNFIQLTSEEITSNLLKRDDLYKLYLDNRKRLQSSQGKIDEFLKRISELPYKYEKYKENNQSKSNRSMFIKKELEEKEITIDFRTITVTKTEEGNVLKEAFPLPSKTFSQFYEVKGYPEIYDSESKNTPIIFEESYLKKEIEKDFFLFVFIEDSLGKIIDIDIISNFSFSDLSVSAKKVYQNTIIAFEKGDVELFTVQSDNMNLHIRTKAKDGNDTFAFTDGSQQVKRTFWINKTALINLINPHIQEGLREKELVG